MIRHSHIRLSALACVLLMLLSCTAVKVNEYGSIDTTAEVAFSVKWQEGQTDCPERFSVALARHVNTVHYVYDWTEGLAQGNEVRCGDYYLTAFSVNDTLYSDNGSLEKFASTPGYSMRDISVPLIEMGADYAKGCYGEDWIDTNTDFPFVSDAGHLYVESFPAALPSGQRTDIVLEPEDVTMEIIFTFYIDAEDGVDLSSVKADISGVPVMFYPMTETVTGAGLGRTAVSEVKEVARNGRRITFEGRVRTLGLFPSDDSSMETGAGIFHVQIGSVIPSGAKVQDESVNISNTIRAAKLMKVSGNGAGYSRNTGSAKLKISTIFKVTATPISE